MSYTSISPYYRLELQENEFNQQYVIGDEVHFMFNEGSMELSGKIIKKYTNSCLIDISQAVALITDGEDLYNGKVVVNYKKIEGVSVHE